MKLYELTEAYQNIQQLMEDENVDIDMLKKALQNVETEIEEKAENIAKLIKNYESEAKALEEEEKRLYQRRKTIENKIASLKEYLEEQLRKVGLDKVKTKIFTVALQNNAPSVEIIDETLIPESYFKIERIVMKKELLADLKEGKDIPGVQIKVTQSLRIR